MIRSIAYLLLTLGLAGVGVTAQPIQLNVDPFCGFPRLGIELDGRRSNDTQDRDEETSYDEDAAVKESADGLHGSDDKRWSSKRNRQRQAVEQNADGLTN